MLTLPCKKISCVKYLGHILAVTWDYLGHIFDITWDWRNWWNTTELWTKTLHTGARGLSFCLAQQATFSTAVLMYISMIHPIKKKYQGQVFCSNFQRLLQYKCEQLTKHRTQLLTDKRNNFSSKSFEQWILEYKLSSLISLTDRF